MHALPSDDSFASSSSRRPYQWYNIYAYDGEYRDSPLLPEDQQALELSALVYIGVCVIIFGLLLLRKVRRRSENPIQSL